MVVLSEQKEEEKEIPQDQIESLLQQLMVQGMSRKEAVQESALLLGVPKNRVYTIARQLGREEDELS